MCAAGGSGIKVPVSLRAAAAGDRDFLVRVYASTREHELAQVPWSAMQKTAFIGVQFDAQHRHFETCFQGAEFSIIELDGEPVGRLYVDRNADEIRIVDIALLPDHRGAGIGGGLLDALLLEAQQAGKPVRIHVEQSNRALAFYERRGFTRIGGSGAHWLLEWSPADHLAPC